MAKSKRMKLARPMINTGRYTYYSSEFGSADEYRRQTARGIHNQTKPMLRLPNRAKIKVAQKKSSGGAGG